MSKTDDPLAETVVIWQAFAHATTLLLYRTYADFTETLFDSLGDASVHQLRPRVVIDIIVFNLDVAGTH
eukprot:5380067-Amphidinium_carterae.1